MAGTFVAYRRWRGHDGRAETLVLKDGFVWGAALFGPLWAMYHGRWRTAAALGLGWAVAGGFASLAGNPAGSLIYMIVAYWSGMSARGLEALWLKDQDWRLDNVILARNLDVAEAQMIADDASRFVDAERRW